MMDNERISNVGYIVFFFYLDDTSSRNLPEIMSATESTTEGIY